MIRWGEEGLGGVLGWARGRAHGTAGLQRQILVTRKERCSTFGRRQPNVFLAGWILETEPAVVAVMPRRQNTPRQEWK